MKLFCSHHYELSNNFEIKSEFDIVVEKGYVPNTWNSRKRKYVTDYVCKKCGKLKRLTTYTSH